jgi:hypothetical protein
MSKGQFPGNSALILATGMRRSASTWLYNAARLLLCSSPAVSQSFNCGWIGDWNNLQKKKFMLIKAHDYDQRLVDDSNFILYSYRDLRDAIASGFRKFGWAPTIEVADEMVRQHELWMDSADFVMRYESMLLEKEDTVTRLARALDIHDVEPAGIVRTIEELNYLNQGTKNDLYHYTNLYHRGHITDGRHGSWKNVLDENYVKAITEKHRGWFEKHGYSLDSP